MYGVTRGDVRAPSLSHPVCRPDPMLQLLGSRLRFERGAFAAAPPTLRLVGRGDRHPALVRPGVIGGDESTAALPVGATRAGPLGARRGLGRTVGPTDETVDGIPGRLADLHRRYGQKVSVVGGSLGGIYAREMARHHPNAVREVITVGSPFRMRDGDRSAASAIADPGSANGRAEALPMAAAEQNNPPLPVPATAIYARADGVAR